MTENKEKMTKLEAFIQKGGLRCFTSGALSRKLAALSAAVLVGGAAFMPTQANAAPPRRHSRDSARAVSILGIVNAGLNSAGALSNITASFLRKPEAQRRLNAIVAEYHAQVQQLNADCQSQIGTVGKDAIPYVEEYLAYRKNPASKTSEQVAQLEQSLGRSGMAMVWLTEACNAYNDKIEAKKEGRKQDEVAASKREVAFLRQARKSDEKLTQLALSHYGIKKNTEGKYESWVVLDRLDVIRNKEVNPRHNGGTDQQWLAAYEKQAQSLRKQYNAMANQIAREISGYDASIQREMGNALFGTGAILLHSHDIHRINEHWGHHRRGR